MSEEQQPTADSGESAEARTLGIERWVLVAFFVLAGISFVILDQLVTVVWNEFREPSAPIVSAIAAVGGFAIAFLAYKEPRANEFAHDVIGELAKVTWPSRDETWAATVVVIVTSLLAAIITGIFDAAWSSVTDLIYKV